MTSERRDKLLNASFEVIRSLEVLSGELEAALSMPGCSFDVGKNRVKVALSYLMHVMGEGSAVANEIVSAAMAKIEEIDESGVNEELGEMQA